MSDSKSLWVNLHKESRYRPKYPSEVVVQYVFRNFKRDGSEKILDLGCGAGRHVVFMANENIQSYGIDYSIEGVKYTRELLDYSGHEKYTDNIKEGELTNINFANEYFDGIICFGVLYYLKEQEINIAIKEIYRILKPGGKLFLQVRTTDDYRCSRNNQKLEGEGNTYIINENDGEKCAHSENGMVMHFFTRQELEGLLKSFINVKIDLIEETHNNGEFKDSNYIVTAEKE